MIEQGKIFIFWNLNSFSKPQKKFVFFLSKGYADRINPLWYFILNINQQLSLPALLQIVFVNHSSFELIKVNKYFLYRGGSRDFEKKGRSMSVTMVGHNNVTNYKILAKYFFQYFQIFFHKKREKKHLHSSKREKENWGKLDFVL